MGWSARSGVDHRLGIGVPEIDGFQATWKPPHCHEFAALAELFEIVWATTWEHKANEAIAPLLGLPPLPVVEFGQARMGDTWKLPAVAAFAGDRPRAWVDDELFADAHRWADRRDEPTLLIRPQSSVGITHAHFAELHAFGRAMAERSDSNSE